MSVRVLLFWGFFKVVYFSLYWDTAWILRNYEENLFFFFFFCGKFIAFKIYTLAHDIRKNTVIFLVISSSCHTNSPSLFLLHWLSICFHVLLKNILFPPLSYHLTFPSACFPFCTLLFSCVNCTPRWFLRETIQQGSKLLRGGGKITLKILGLLMWDCN